MSRIDNLFLDIERGNNEVVKEVLHGEGIDKKDRYGRTALINSAFYGNSDLLQWLVENGADVDASDKSGYTALHFSSQENKLDCTKLLIKNKAYINAGDMHGNTPAWVTLMNWGGGKNFDTLKELVDNGAELKILNKAGRHAYGMVPDTLKQQLGIE